VFGSFGFVWTPEGAEDNSLVFFLLENGKEGGPVLLVRWEGRDDFDVGETELLDEFLDVLKAFHALFERDGFVLVVEDVII